MVVHDSANQVSRREPVDSAHHSLDRFTQSTAAQVVAFGWGLAEATVFVIVPDVLLTVLGCRSIRSGLRAALSALVGALAGGLITYAAGRSAPEATQDFLVYLPGIQPGLIQTVELELNEQGLGALFLGPLRGTPYKIYAGVWGARRGSLVAFLAASIPARGIRFLVSLLLAATVSRIIARWTRGRVRTELMLLSVFWIAFYSFYFSRFGW